MGFDPLTMAVVASATMSAGSQIAAGQSAKTVGDYNARAQMEQARITEAQGAAEAASMRNSFEKFRGALAGDVAAQGGSTTSGTGLMFAVDAAERAMLDQRNTLIQTGNQAASARSGATVSAYEGRTARTQAVMGGFGSALGSYASWKGLRG